MNKTLTLFDAVQLWEQSPICVKNPRLKQNLTTVMKNYILPSFGLDMRGKRSDYLSLMKDISFVDFLAGTRTILDSFSNPQDYGIKSSTLKYYRNIAVKFFDFLYCLIDDSQVTASFSPIPEILPQRESIPSQKSSLDISFPPQKMSISLTGEEISIYLKNEVSLFCDYTLNQGFEQTTIDNYLGHIFYFLGWLLRHKSDYILSELSLEPVTDEIYIHSFLEWGLTERGNSLGWGLNVIHACILVARFLVEKGGNYESELLALRNYLRVMSNQYWRENKEAKEIEEKLSFSMAMKIVDYLRTCCAVNHGNGSPRSEIAIVKSWQRYLLVALLVACPIRSNHLCQLTLNDSLIWNNDRFYVDLSVLNSKVSASMMEHIPIPGFLSEDLLKWCQELRPLVGSNNNYVFMKLGSPRCPESKGQPLAVKDLSDLVGTCTSKAMLNVFGNAIALKPTNLSGLKNDYLQMLAIIQKTQEDSRIIPQIDLKDLTNERPRRELGEITKVLKQINNPHFGRKKYPLLSDL